MESKQLSEELFEKGKINKIQNKINVCYTDVLKKNVNTKAICNLQ